MTRGSASAEQRVGGEQMLVVDGDPRLGPAIVEQLIADGYQAELARTAEHARVRARAGAPRLVVLGDLDPPRGALDLVEEISQSDRADTPWEADTPVIVIGSRARKLDMLRAFELGADDYLARPARLSRAAGTAARRTASHWERRPTWPGAPCGTACDRPERALGDD